MNEVLLVLALLLRFNPDHPTWFSVREVPQGTPHARWEPCYEGGWHSLGDEKRVPCTPYLSVRGAWVVKEDRDHRTERLRTIADVMVTVAEENHNLWPGTVHEFAMSMASTSAWSTGLREDIEMGRARGPAGEVCLADVQEKTARQFAPPELAKLPSRELLAALVGTDRASLHRCLTVLARGLAHARQWAEHCNARQPVLERAFSVYNVGQCEPLAGWKARKRYETLAVWLPHKLPQWPAWYSPTGKEGVTPVAESQ